MFKFLCCHVGEGAIGRYCGKSDLAWIVINIDNNRRKRPCKTGEKKASHQVKKRKNAEKGDSKGGDNGFFYDKGEYKNQHLRYWRST